ncbi:hypothetical protein LTR62_003747 [Meristemomyces frigidus]|uniref:Uncharacterized protein n=1 Tax=Meristemomyces frigidus TaxID=1508187 RepID=A0AAN7TK26_9PEZI|nr:hypothetical protein LTR62_003747 [Meristemomyces frigidus]
MSTFPTSSSPSLSAQSLMPLLYALVIPIPVVIVLLCGSICLYRCLKQRCEANKARTDIEVAIASSMPQRSADREAVKAVARTNASMKMSALVVPLPVRFAGGRSGIGAARMAGTPYLPSKRAEGGDGDVALQILSGR